MMKKGKYHRWGTFLKKQREKRFRSAREFCLQASIKISYPQYSRYEAGDQLPSLEHALSFCATLGGSPIETLLEWSRAQVPAEDIMTLSAVNELLEGVREQAASEPAARASRPVPVTERDLPLDDLIVFNRSHLNLFRSDPAYRDIFTYVNSFTTDGEWIPEGELASALGLEGGRLHEMLSRLAEVGVLVLRDGACRASKRNFYFPDDADFFELRNLNLTHNAQSILSKLRHEDLSARKAFRGLLTREMTDAQVSALMSGIDQLINQMVVLPENDRPRTIYSLCVLFGERFSRVGGALPT